MYLFGIPTTETVVYDYARIQTPAMIRFLRNWSQHQLRAGSGQEVRAGAIWSHFAPYCDGSVCMFRAANPQQKDIVRVSADGKLEVKQAGEWIPEYSIIGWTQESSTTA